jgi:hypothetical protein
MSAILVRYEAAKAALQSARTFDDVMAIRNVSEAAAAFAKIAKDDALVIEATGYRTDAERRLGEMLSQMPKAGGKGNLKKGESPGSSRGDSGEIRLSEIGVTKNQSSQFQKLAAIPEQKYAEEKEKSAAKNGMVSSRAIVRATAPKTTPRTVISKPPVKPTKETGELDRLKAENAKLLRAAAARDKELTLYSESLEADDKTAPLLKEIKKLNERIRILEERNVGLQAEKAEAVRASESWRRKAEKK